MQCHRQPVRFRIMPDALRYRHLRHAAINQIDQYSGWLHMDLARRQ